MTNPGPPRFLVFVYGTLKSGCSNHFCLAGAEFLGTARTVAPMALHRGDLPMAARTPGISPIQGELYRVTAGHLRRLDRFEEHPEVYQREQALVIDCDHREWRAWIYFHRTPAGPLIEDGRYVETGTPAAG